MATRTTAATRARTGPRFGKSDSSKLIFGQTYPSNTGPLRPSFITRAATAAKLLLSVFATTAWAANRPIVFGNPGLTVRVASKLNTFTDAGAGLSAVLTGGTATNTPLVTV